MRKEVEQVVKQHGWTKEAMDKLPHLDSFLRESHRFNGLGGSESSFISVRASTSSP